MKYLVFFLLYLPLTLQAQPGFKTSLGLDPGQTNRANHVLEHEDKFYCSGQYFDTLYGLWNTFIAIYDQKGNYIKHHLIRNDTVPSVNLNNYVYCDGVEYSVLGRRSTRAPILTYNFELDSFYVSHNLSRESTLTTPWAFVKDSISKQIYACGTKYLGGLEHPELRIYTIIENDTLYHIIKDHPKSLYPLNMRLNHKGELVVVALNSIGNGYKHRDSTFVMILDNKLNVLHNSLDTDQQSDATMGKEMFIDSNNEIVCTHHRRFLIDTSLIGIGPNDDWSKPGVMKFDETGKHLWTVELGNSINNFYGNGVWNSIIESNEKDGYIIVGSESYQTESRDTILADAAIAKVSYDGDSLWMRRYSYEREGNVARDILNDVYPTSDGGYITAGKSDGADYDPHPIIYTILMKLDSEGRLDTSTSNIVTIDHSDDLIIYPNPTAGPVYLTQQGNNTYDLLLLNTAGQKIRSFRLDGRDHTLIVDPAYFAIDGIYYLRITDQTGHSTVKQIVVGR